MFSFLLFLSGVGSEQALMMRTPSHSSRPFSRSRWKSHRSLDLSVSGAHDLGPWLWHVSMGGKSFDSCSMFTMMFPQVSSVAQGRTSDSASGTDLDAMVDYMNQHLEDYCFTVLRGRCPTKFNFPMLRPRLQSVRSTDFYSTWSLLWILDDVISTHSSWCLKKTDDSWFLKMHDDMTCGISMA